MKNHTHVCLQLILMLTLAPLWVACSQEAGKEPEPPAEPAKAQAPQAKQETPPPPPAPVPVPAPEAEVPASKTEPAPPAPPKAPEPEGKAAPALPPPPPPSEATAPPLLPDGQVGIRLNFRGAPLDAVLDHLSKAAGFVIVKEADITERIDAWSHHPLTQDDAVALLNTVLHEKGYAVIRSERILKIVKRSDAKTRDLPIRTGADPEAIPKGDEMVTQIIPIRNADAAKLIDNLKPLLPTDTVMNANASSNAILITDTMTNIRRMTEIIKALDTSISNILEVKVIPLQYADSEELAKVVTQIFQGPSDQSASRRNNDRRQRMAQFFSRMRGGGFGGSGGEGDGGSSDGGPSEAKAAVSHISAVAEPQSNSLVVSAPGDLLPDIEELVKQLDIPTEDATTLQVFPLEHSDAVDMAEKITQLFDSDSQNSQSGSNSRRSFFMGGMMGGGRGGAAAANQQQTARQLAEAKVVAVADTRTNAVIVSASKITMDQVRIVIEKLDANTAKQQEVFVHQLENADVEQVKQVLDGMFDDTTTSGSSTGRTSGMTGAYTPWWNRSAGGTQGTTRQGGSSGFSRGGTGR